MPNHTLTLLAFCRVEFHFQAILFELKLLTKYEKYFVSHDCALNVLKAHIKHSIKLKMRYHMIMHVISTLQEVIYRPIYCNTL